MARRTLYINVLLYFTPHWRESQIAARLRGLIRVVQGFLPLQPTLQDGVGSGPEAVLEGPHALGVEDAHLVPVGKL